MSILKWFKASTRIVSEQAIARITYSIKRNEDGGNIWSSPDNTHVAYIAIVDKKQFLVIDGKEEKQYDDISSNIAFSPDSKRVAYVATLNKKQFLVIDGKEEKQYDCIFGKIVFSPDSKHIAYVACVNNKQFAVIDGKEEKQYNSIQRDIVLSPDSKHVAYVACVSNKQFAVIDGKEEKQYDGIKNWNSNWIAFSPDSKYVAYVATLNNKQFLVIDGKEEKQHDGISSNIVFSPDSKRVAYLVQEGNEKVLFINGKEEMRHVAEGPRKDLLKFSPDSKHFALIASPYIFVDGIEEKFVGGNKGKLFQQIFFLYFGPDSERIAYLVYLSGMGNNCFYVIDKKAEKPYGFCFGLVFSPDSKHVAYSASFENMEFMVINGKKQMYNYNRIINGSSKFISNDILQYQAIRDQYIYLVEVKIE